MDRTMFPDDNVIVGKMDISKLEPENDKSETTSTISSSCSDSERMASPQIAYHVYRRRWFMVFLFAFSFMVNGFQWIAYSVIPNILTDYYTVDVVFINGLAIIYMVTYVIFAIPGAYLSQVQGLRICVVLGITLTTGGAWIKVFSADPNLFWVTFFGQTVAGLGQVFIYGIPPRVAAVWFGPDQVSTASAIAVLGNQVGVALGFFLPPILVPSAETDPDQITKNLKVLFYGTAVICTVLLILVIVAFQDAPPTPPSLAASEIRSINYPQSLKNVLTNKNFVIFLFAYAISTGVMNAFSVLLTQLVTMYFPDQEESAGLIGLLTIISGVIGATLCGRILDKTHRFKEISIFINAIAIFGGLGFTFIIGANALWAVFVIMCFNGFFFVAFLAMGYEYGVELTFPEDEAISGCLLSTATYIGGIIITSVTGWLLPTYGALSSNLTATGCLVVAFVITICVYPDLRRLRSQREGQLNANSCDPVVTN